MTPPTTIDPATGILCGDAIQSSERMLADLASVFADAQAYAELDPRTVVYRVQCQMKVQEGKAGGLFFGTSFLKPGRVGDEYFMTKGHLHAKRDTGEYYWGIKGQGALILMDEDRRCWYEPVYPGSLHYIPGCIAHRLANIGDRELAVGACWPSDAGHDYASIAEQGFSARLRCVDGQPTLVAEASA